MKELLEEGPGFSLYKAIVEGPSDSFPGMSRVHVKLQVEMVMRDGSIQEKEAFIYNLPMLRGLRDALNKHLEINQ